MKEAIEDGNQKRIEKAIYVATQERTRYFARRIARTEMARAYGDGVMETWADDEDCVAFKWHTSSGHPFCDICDLYGNADLYGMGKGVYPKDKVPRLPIHPNCMCHLQPIMDGSDLIQGKEKDNVEKGGMAYIKSLKKYEQEQLLGEHGRKEVLRKGDWRTYTRGYSGDVMKKRGIISSGAIYGALNDKNDPWQKRRNAHAKRYYETLRNSNKNYIVETISNHTGLRRATILKVLEHLLYNRYNLAKGVGRFDESYEISLSFQRLLSGNIEKIQGKDIIMLKHERLEYELMNRYGYGYRPAHEIANRKYNYEELIKGAHE